MVQTGVAIFTVVEDGQAKTILGQVSPLMATHLRGQRTSANQEGGSILKLIHYASRSSLKADWESRKSDKGNIY